MGNYLCNIIYIHCYYNYCITRLLGHVMNFHELRHWSWFIFGIWFGWTVIRFSDGD